MPGGVLGGHAARVVHKVIFWAGGLETLAVMGAHRNGVCHDSRVSSGPARFGDVVVGFGVDGRVGGDHRGLG